MGDPLESVRRATPANAELVTDVITAAFAADPLWGRALARADQTTDHQRLFWRQFIDGALRYPWTWVANGGQAVAVWIPPGQREMSEAQETHLEKLATQYLGDGADPYRDLVHHFEQEHPRAEPHYYLSLLATHPEHRGRGIGMALLAHTLELIDAEGFPAYLESSNPANVDRYIGVGFVPVDEFPFPGGPLVTTMWRPAPARADDPRRE